MIAIFPEIVATSSAGDVERLAILVRRYFGGAQTFAPKPDLAALVETAGLSLRFLGLGSEGALLAKDERGAFSIVMVVNQRLDTQATQFMIAHLLGHYLLDIQPIIARGEWQVSGYQEEICALTRYCKQSNGNAAARKDEGREMRADAFAAALLLPRAMVIRAMEKLQDPVKVATFFGVSRACLQRRLSDLGLVMNDPVNFLDAEIRAGVNEANSSPADTDTGESQLVSPEGSMPRAYAASTYGATEKLTRNQPTVAAPVRTPNTHSNSGITPKLEVNSAPAPGAAAASSSSSLRGMDRLREIARKLDKGVPPQR